MENTSKKKSGTGKNLAIVALATAALAAGVIAYTQHEKKENLKKLIKIEKADMEKHLFDSFAELEHNLAQITAHERVLVNDLEGSKNWELKNPEERVQREIEIIESLMSKNERIIEDLNNRVGEQDDELVEYESRIKKLGSRVVRYKDKAEKLMAANEELSDNLALSRQESAKLSSSLSEKEQQNLQQADLIKMKENELLKRGDEIEQKTKELNKAYFVVGSFNELKEAEIVEKDGGIIGIGATKTLTEDFNKDAFTQIDRRYYNLIPVYGKKVELISNHNEDAYEVVTDEDGAQWVKITDHEEFWENSKYLVVMVKDKMDLGFLSANK